MELTHITLNTGHIRISSASEIEPDIIEKMRDDLRAAISRRGHVALSGVDGCTITATAKDATLIATAWRGNAPLVTLGVAPTAVASRELWPILCASLPPDVAVPDQPESPWAATRIEPSLALHPEDTRWLSDWEQCIAWAWILMREKSPGQGIASVT